MSEQQNVDVRFLTRRNLLKGVLGGALVASQGIAFPAILRGAPEQEAGLYLEDIPNLDKLDDLLKGNGLGFGTNRLMSAAYVGNKGHVVFQYYDNHENLEKVVALSPKGTKQPLYSVSSLAGRKDVADFPVKLNPDSSMLAYIRREKKAQGSGRGGENVSAIISGPNLEQIASINLTTISANAGDAFPQIISFGNNKNELILEIGSNLYAISPNSSRKIEFPEKYIEPAEKESSFAEQQTLALFDRKGRGFDVQKSEAKLRDRILRFERIRDIEPADYKATGLEAVFTRQISYDGFGDIYGVKQGVFSPGELVLVPLVRSSTSMSAYDGLERRTFSNPVVKGNLMAVQERIAEIKDGYATQKYYLLVFPIKNGEVNYYDHKSTTDNGSKNPIRNYAWIDVLYGANHYPRLVFVKSANEQHCPWYVNREKNTGNLPYDFVDSIDVYNPSNDKIEKSLGLAGAKTPSGANLWHVGNIAHKNSQKGPEIILSGFSPTPYCYDHAFVRLLLKQ